MHIPSILVVLKSTAAIDEPESPGYAVHESSLVVKNSKTDEI